MFNITGLPIISFSNPPSAPSADPVIWDGAQEPGSGSISLNAEKTIATFNNAGAGDTQSVASLSSVPDTNKRVIAFKYAGAPVSAGSLAAMFIAANGSFDGSNIFPTLFGNTFLINGSVENPQEGNFLVGKDSVGSFILAEPQSNVSNSDVVTFIIDGTNWQFYVNSTRIRNAVTNPSGGTYDIAFDRILAAALDFGGPANIVSIETLSTAAKINAQGYTRWLPSGSQDYAGNPITVGVGTKTAWRNPVDGVTVQLSRLSNSDKTADLTIGGGVTDLSCASSIAIGPASTFSNWVVQEFRLDNYNMTNSESYQIDIFLSPEGGQNIQVRYDRQIGGAQTLEASDQDGGGAFFAVPTLGINDRLAIATKPSTGEWKIFYKPSAGAQQVVSDTLISLWTGPEQLLYKIDCTDSGNAAPANTGLSLELMQDSGDFTLDYSSLTGGAETINQEAV